MSLTRDGCKASMKSIAMMGETSGELAKDFGWRKLSSEEIHVRSVLWNVHRVGLEARDVLDLMEGNDEL